jgi:hypothetical protein
MRRRTVLLLLLVALITGAAACGDDDEPVATAPDGGTDRAGSLGGGEGGLAVAVAHVGGFLTPELVFTRLPHVVVYDDGLSVTQGAVIAIYPGPAVPPLVEGRLDRDQLAELEEAARDAGLFEARDRDEFGMPPVADAPDTRITVVVDGEEIVTEVGALGFGSTMPGEGDAGVTEEQARRRAAVEEFVDLASELATAAETSEMFDVDRYRVMALPAEGAPGVDGIEPNELDWPAEAELTENECTAVTGADARAVADVLDEATEITRWVDDDGETWRLAIRPVLPHEPDC